MVVQLRSVDPLKIRELKAAPGKYKDKMVTY